MEEDTRLINDYYSPNNLYNKIVSGLERLGIDLSSVTLDDLQPVDEFHIRGDTATKELIELAQFSPGLHILDVGCGIGGSSRRLSRAAGCHVTGIDLSREYIDTAQRLTHLLKMQERVSFRACSALDLPFSNESFDGAWSLQMNMNIEDKLTWLQEIHRVLRPGSRAILYEVCGGTSTPLYFPVPWAQNSTMSFLETPGQFRSSIVAAGFVIQTWNDRTALATRAFADIKEPDGEPVLPELGVYLLVGNDIQTKAFNLRRNLEEERVSLLEIVAVKP